MQVGDPIEILFLADKAFGVITHVEKYEGAYIVGWVNPRKQQSLLVCFPDLPYLPQHIFDEDKRPDLFSATAWLYWKEHIWPVPVGTPSTKRIGPESNPAVVGSREIHTDPIEHAKEKIRHILKLSRHMASDLIIHPGDDAEQELHNRWWR